MSRKAAARGIVLIVWAGCLALSASAAEEVVLLYNRGIPQTEFAASEIRLALGARGDTCVHRELNELKTPGATRIALAFSSEEARKVAEALGVRPLAKDSPAQSYSLRQKSDGSQTIYAVLSADPAGAMYGGLDIAEAIQTGALAELKVEVERDIEIAKGGGNR